MFGWRRVRFTLLLSGILGFVTGLSWKTGPVEPAIRSMLLGMVALTAFGIFEQWPKRLPRGLARWVLQVVAVAVVVVPTMAILTALATRPGDPPFYRVPTRMNGFAHLTIMGILIAPWTALGALVRQKDALARDQALAFALEKSELEREATEARLRVLQGQVAPHFLFNTLANVRALVDTNSPRASAVLGSLIAYLRAAVPRLDRPMATFDEELELVRAYLDLMHMRMPDRLRYTIQIEDEARALHCPPMTLLTLVENAVRHGIDPSEEGGLIDIRVARRGPRCHVLVRDTGAGLSETGKSLGTGLSTLRERLRLAFAGDARVTVTEEKPQGVRAELEFPAVEAAA
jgi:sensor histidine kinase YesM